MNPEFLDNMSWEMAEVYGAISDQIIINLARHFPFYVADTVPTSAFAYQAQMLAQMGQINRETVKIIRQNLLVADDALNRVLEQSIIDAVRTAEPELWEGAKRGIVQPPQSPVVAPNQMRAFQLYYQQSADKLNHVNTVMLESTRQAYAATVADIAARVQATQSALNIATGEVVTGVSSWNTAVKHATDRMKKNGITGFIDHANHHWSAEAYVAMDVRTTVFNTSRAAVWETNENWGNDLYIVSYHNGARPGCYPWQNKVISSINAARDVTDLDGNTVHVYAQNETSYGEPAGLFGINCGHYPNPFIPGVSVVDGHVQNEEENKRSYEQSQEQRRLERRVREEKRDLEALKAQGADEQMISAQREKVKAASQDIDSFCKETGRQRHRNRESVYTQRDFPAADTYDPAEFTRDQQERIRKWYEEGVEQKAFTFGQMEQKSSALQDNANNIIAPTNKNGEVIQFAGKLNDPEYNVTREQISQLAAEFNTNLQNVKLGTTGRRHAGEVDITGSTMGLSSPKQKRIVIHEFAHTMSNADATKYGLNNDTEFWKEIRSIRTQYRKHIKTHPTEYISTYAESDNSIDEFMAEGFALAYMREKEIEIPFMYGKDVTYSDLVLKAIRKYFGK